MSDPVLGPDELNANLADAFDQQRPYVVTSVGPGVATLELGEAGLMIRPGGTVSGPTVMALVDAAAWIVLLAHIGWEPLRSPRTCPSTSWPSRIRPVSSPPPNC
jgi:acyl-coenzyme A thioesterase PaaI-like protein